MFFRIRKNLYHCNQATTSITNCNESVLNVYRVSIATNSKYKNFGFGVRKFQNTLIQQENDLNTFNNEQRLSNSITASLR